jgi:hypothetical protein
MHMPRVFLCYRYDDAADHATRLYDRLVDRFGRDQIFPDLYSQQSPVKAIHQMVAARDVFLAVIGSHWLNVVDAQGQRRLDDPNDLIHVEIATALQWGVPVIPVLVDGARLPRTQDLPVPLRELVSRNVELRDTHWSMDVDRLFTIVENLGGPRATPHDQPHVLVDAGHHVQVSEPQQAPLPTPRGPTRVGDIFLSYAQEDRDNARLVAEVLSRRGWSVWWDRRIPIGKSYDEAIASAPDAAKCVVVLWSRAAAASRWTRIEANEGQRRGILRPALLEDIPIPLAFRDLQAADLVHWTGDPDADGFRDLADAVAELVDPHER